MKKKICRRQDRYARQKRYQQTPKGRYIKQKQNARGRGVPFLLTFAEWWSIWEASKKWSRRGNRLGCYCMMRRQDIGPYSRENVVIGLWQDNTAERNQTVILKRHTHEYTEVSFSDSVPF